MSLIKVRLNGWEYIICIESVLVNLVAVDTRSCTRSPTRWSVHAIRRLVHANEQVFRHSSNTEAENRYGARTCQIQSKNIDELSEPSTVAGQNRIAREGEIQEIRNEIRISAADGRYICPSAAARGTSHFQNSHCRNSDVSRDCHLKRTLTHVHTYGR